MIDKRQWIIPMDEDATRGDITRILDGAYHNYSIYRTVIVCRNAYCMREVYKQLQSLEIPVVSLLYRWQLETFRVSPFRVLLITFNQWFQYPSYTNEHMFDANNLFILHELSSLQEQFCIYQLTHCNKYYIYVN